SGAEVALERLAQRIRTDAHQREVRQRLREKSGGGVVGRIVVLPFCHLFVPQRAASSRGLTGLPGAAGRGTQDLSGGSRRAARIRKETEARAGDATTSPVEASTIRYVAPPVVSSPTCVLLTWLGESVTPTVRFQLRDARRDGDAEPLRDQL